MRRLQPVVLVVVIALSGCSFAYLSKDGTRYVFGFGELLEGAPRDPGTFVSRPTEFETVGLSVMSFADGYGVALGWLRLREGTLANRAAPAAQDAPSAASSGRDWSFGPFVGAIVPPAPRRAGAGVVTSVETVGLAFIKLGTETAVNLGYGHDALVGLGSDVLVHGNPIEEIEASFSGDDPETGEKHGD